MGELTVSGSGLCLLQVLCYAIIPVAMGAIFAPVVELLRLVLSQASQRNYKDHRSCWLTYFLEDKNASTSGTFYDRWFISEPVITLGALIAISVIAVFIQRLASTSEMKAMYAVIYALIVFAWYLLMILVKVGHGLQMQKTKAKIVIKYICDVIQITPIVALAVCFYFMII